MSLSWLWLLALVTFRVVFAAVLPMTGDEAYFVSWGEHPAGGYYDHPPMVGWWLTGLLAISRAEWVLRLPTLALPLLLAWGAWWLVRPHGTERARAAALLVLLQPVNVWNVLITTDTPLILFSMLSVLAYLAALRSPPKSSGALFWHALAGALLGLAFLGKYFAVLLGLAIVAHALFIRRDDGRHAELALLLAAALPAPIYSLWWNSGHCWVNILFNLMNRHETAGLSWNNPVLYLASLAYLATPWLLFELWRQRKDMCQIVRKNGEARAVFWLTLVPLAAFALMSLWRSIGLHWLASFIPLLAVLAAIVLSQTALVRLLRWSAVFAALHVLAIVLIAALPVHTWKNNKFYDGVVLTVHAEQLIAQLQPYARDYLFAMEGYSPAATLAYNAQRPFTVFGAGSFRARQDDFITDWPAHDGKNVLILRYSAPEIEDYAPFFHHVAFSEFEVQGVRFHLVLGNGFDFVTYRDTILTRIRDRYYRIPAWLPQRGCEFCERYFPVTQCVQ